MKSFILIFLFGSTFSYGGLLDYFFNPGHDEQPQNQISDEELYTITVKSKKAGFSHTVELNTQNNSVKLQFPSKKNCITLQKADFADLNIKVIYHDGTIGKCDNNSPSERNCRDWAEAENLRLQIQRVNSFIFQEGSWQFVGSSWDYYFVAEMRNPNIESCHKLYTTKKNELL